MNIHFYTLGCKVNQYETEAIKELFSSRGHTCDSALPADALVINSCTVTGESDRKTRQLVRRCRLGNPDAAIVLTGCMAQAFPREAAALTEADIVVGNRELTDIVRLTEEYFRSRTRTVDITPHEKGEAYNTPPVSGLTGRTRAFMKIEDGCDRFCSYCIIPSARGRVRSRSLADIADEAARLALGGFCELVLVGINLSAYGCESDFDLCDAVSAVCAADGIRRVRLGSLEPDHITEGMLARLMTQEKFCPQFHLSLQSGCDDTLRRMNRHYDTAFYTELTTHIRKLFPDASVTTDIMVGFPGETEEEFMKSLDFVRSSGFARAHIFAYSRRAGTVAAALKDQISEAEKARRARLMAQAVTESESAFLRSQLGGVYPVLFETGTNGIAEGYTPNYSRVRVAADEQLAGRIRSVRLLSAEDDFCTGELI